MLLAGALALFLPVATRSRAPSLADRAAEAGPGSRQMTAVVVYGVVVAVWTGLVLVRSRTTLATGTDGALTLVVQGPLRRRQVDLTRVRRVMLVTVGAGRGATQRALLLDDADRLLGRPGAHRGFWRRPDTVALLTGAGITVFWEHRINRWQDLEARYPGGALWTDRHPVLLALVVTVLCIAAVLGVAWIFEF